nr:expressed protein [Hymenolepis microstoma]
MSSSSSPGDGQQDISQHQEDSHRLFGPPEFAPSNRDGACLSPGCFREAQVPVGEVEFSEGKNIPIDLIAMFPLSVYESIRTKVEANGKDSNDDTIQNLLRDLDKIKEEDWNTYFHKTHISATALQNSLLVILNAIEAKRKEFDELLSAYDVVEKYEKETKPRKIQLLESDTPAKEVTFEDLEAIPHAEDIINSDETEEDYSKLQNELEMVEMYPMSLIDENLLQAINSTQTDSEKMQQLNNLKETLETIINKDIEEFKKTNLISVKAYQAIKKHYCDVVNSFMNPYYNIFKYIQELEGVIKKSDPVLIGYPKKEEDRQLFREIHSRKQSE